MSVGRIRGDTPQWGMVGIGDGWQGWAGGRERGGRGRGGGPKPRTRIKGARGEGGKGDAGLR